MLCASFRTKIKKNIMFCLSLLNLFPADCLSLVKVENSLVTLNMITVVNTDVLSILLVQKMWVLLVQNGVMVSHTTALANFTVKTKLFPFSLTRLTYNLVLYVGIIYIFNIYIYIYRFKETKTIYNKIISELVLKVFWY
jgi:hypothetical protein